VVTWAGDDVLQVPTGALFRLPAGGWAVFVVRDGRARLRPVEIGHRSDLAAEVLAGLEDGEVVVIHPGDAVTDGARVEVRE
jgi:HlyD family secretion protein